MSFTKLAGVARTSFFGLTLLAAAACNDPAKDKTKAVTTEAKESAVTASPAAAGAKKLAFDQSSSKVEWTGSKVTGKHDGSFKTFSGTVNLVDDKIEASSVTIDIDTTSLSSEPDKLVEHLKSADFFDVAKYPKATFQSTSIKPGADKGTHTVTGNLTLHGVTKSVTFPATIKKSDSGVEADAEFVINRKDFGLVYAGKPDDLIRDDVVIKLTIRAKNNG